MLGSALTGRVGGVIAAVKDRGNRRMGAQTNSSTSSYSGEKSSSARLREPSPYQNDTRNLKTKHDLVMPESPGERAVLRVPGDGNHHVSLRIVLSRLQHPKDESKLIFLVHARDSRQAGLGKNFSAVHLCTCEKKQTRTAYYSLEKTPFVSTRDAGFCRWNPRRFNSRL